MPTPNAVRVQISIHTAQKRME